jgi:hypothetical protein
MVPAIHLSLSELLVAIAAWISREGVDDGGCLDHLEAI